LVEAELGRRVSYATKRDAILGEGKESKLPSPPTSETTRVCRRTAVETGETRGWLVPPSGGPNTRLNRPSRSQSVFDSDYNWSSIALEMFCGHLYTSILETNLY
jgi:hypothetical protein